jgi:effector-binding domain-containing protein
MSADPRRGFDFLSPDFSALPPEVTWRIGIEVEAETQVESPLEKASCSWPEVVRVRRTGPYETVHLAYDQLGPYIEEENFFVTGPFLMRWFDDPARTPPERRRFELLVPVARSQTAQRRVEHE